jgi:hypothetical protein
MFQGRAPEFYDSLKIPLRRQVNYTQQFHLTKNSGRFCGKKRRFTKPKPLCGFGSRKGLKRY